jgi:DNA-binding FadR family transcriptional regulator
MLTVQSQNRSTSLTQSVQAKLRERIRRGIYPVGHRLPTEAALVEEFRVSRTVVREAVSRLQAAGLVETRHGVGTFVREPTTQASFSVQEDELATLQDVISVLELRMAVEAEAAALAAERRTTGDLRRMKAALKRFEADVAQGGQAIEHDLAFHQAIARATQNPRFVSLFSALGEGAIPRARLRRDGLTKQSGGAVVAAPWLLKVHEEHMAVLSAIEAGHAQHAREAMRNHLLKGKERRAAALRRQASTLPYPQGH